LQNVPGFVTAFEFDDGKDEDATEEEEEGEETGGDLLDRDAIEETYGPFDYNNFLSQEKNGAFPGQGGAVDPVPFDSLTNNNSGSAGTANFTQSETTLVAFGNSVVVGFNDAGSNSGGTNKFTGWSYSTDGGATFTDGGTLPTSAVGDAGDPVMA